MISNYSKNSSFSKISSINLMILKSWNEIKTLEKNFRNSRISRIKFLII